MSDQPRQLTVGSLFAGIGGFELGLEMTGGFRTVWQVEIDDYARRVLTKHWPDVPRWGDIKTFPPTGPSPWTRQNRRRHWKTPDVICGGFPCQDISFAGRGAGLAGDRSGLWYEFARVIGVVRPRYVLVENVAALLSKGLDAVLGTLASLGYDAEWHCVAAAHVGAPHIRDRVWIIAHAVRTDRESGTGRRGIRQGDSNAPHAASNGRHARSGEPSDEEETWSGRSEPAGSGKDVADTDGYGRDKAREGIVSTRNERSIGNAWWAAEPDVDRVAHGIPARVDRLRCLGNAVVPQVAELIGRMVLNMEASA